MSVGNTGSRMVGYTEFYGGLSTDKKIGIENSFADAECLDVRKSPSQMTVLPMARQLDDSDVITGLMTAMTQTKDGNIWGVDEGGKVYKIDDNDTVSVASEVATGSGFSLEYFEIDDGLWWADNGHKLYSYGKILNPAGNARNTNEFEYLQDLSEYVVYAIEKQENEGQLFYQSNPDIRRSEGTATCAVPIAVDETEANKAIFLPATTNTAKIGVYFTAIGASGTVKLLVHDEADNVVAYSEDVDVSELAVGYNQFEVRPNPSNMLSASNQFNNYLPWSGDTIEAGAVFHLHIVASDTGSVVRTSVANDMSLTLDFISFAYILNETFNKKHPMSVYDKLYIGNGQYVSSKISTPLNSVEDYQLIQNQVRIDDGFEVCSFGSSDEYLMIGAEKYSANSTRGFQAGRIYFWDRMTEAPSFYIECNMGSPKAIFNMGNIVYVIIAGALYAYTGGKELVKVRTLAGTDTEYSGRRSLTEVYPNMMAIRREILMIGFPSSTTAYTIRHGINAFGSVDKNYPNCFTYNYRVPGKTASDPIEQYNSDEQSLRIGCVYNFSDTLFYSYEVGTKNGDTWTYDTGLAVVDNDSGTETSFSWKSLQYDAGSPVFEKQALRVGIYFDPLPANTTITPMFRIDNGEWEMGPATAVAGDRKITCEINRRFHELQYGFVGTSGNDLLTPVIKQVSAEVRILNEEGKIYA